MALHKALKRTHNRVNRANGQLGGVVKMMANGRHPALIFYQLLAHHGAVKKIRNDDFKAYTAVWLSGILSTKINASALSAEEDQRLRAIRRNLDSFSVEQLLAALFLHDGLNGRRSRVKK